MHIEHFGTKISSSIIDWGIDGCTNLVIQTLNLRIIKCVLRGLCEADRSVSWFERAVQRPELTTLRLHPKVCDSVREAV